MGERERKRRRDRRRDRRMGGRSVAQKKEQRRRSKTEQSKQDRPAIVHRKQMMNVTSATGKLIINYKLHKTTLKLSEFFPPLRDLGP